MKINYLVIILVLFCALLGAVGQIFFKMASKNFSLSIKGLFLNYKFLIGSLLYATSAILFIWSLKFGNVSILYPLIATSYIWVGLFAYFFLGESFSFINWAIGAVLILAGITIIIR